MKKSTKRKTQTRSPLKGVVRRRKNPFGDEDFTFSPGFYYQTTNIPSNYGQGTNIIYVSKNGNVYRVDQKTRKFLKMLDVNSEVMRTYYRDSANNSYWELFLEPVKNNKILRFLENLKTKQNIQETPSPVGGVIKRKSQQGSLF